MFSKMPARGLSTLLTLPLLLLACADDPLAPSRDPEPTPSLVPLPGFVAVDMGYRHACAIRDDGTVICWGDNEEGQATVPAGLQDVVQVSGGNVHTCALDRNGALTCWGSNHLGQSDVPAGLTAAKQVSAGFTSTCAIDGDDRVVCWGANTTGFYAVPDDLGPAAQVIAGYQYHCALGIDGSVRCWGDHREPAGLTGATELASGEYHICASRSAGTVVCWGQNNFGAVDVPAAIADGAVADVVEVSSGGYHTCARTRDGDLICWGEDGLGQGDVPAGLPPVVQVSVGRTTTCVLTIHGAVVCWGNDDFGQASAPTHRVNPAATFGYPISVPLGDDFVLSLADAHVPGSFGPASFTFAFDCGDGSGYGDYGPDENVSCVSGAVGQRTVGGKVRDEDGDVAEYTGVVTTVFAFDGFFPPLRTDVPNVVMAGQAIPIRFSLGGDHGLNILADGSPASYEVSCTTADDAASSIETVTTGRSGLSYDTASDTYTYTWKTSRMWAGSCRRLTLAFVDDAPPRTAEFLFR